MTLTGAIPKALQPRALDALKALYRRAGGPVWVDAVSVLIQPTREGRFGLIARFPLRAPTPVIGLGR
jgi:hypothetical protein